MQGNCPRCRRHYASGCVLLILPRIPPCRRSCSRKLTMRKPQGNCLIRPSTPRSHRWATCKQGHRQFPIATIASLKHTVEADTSCNEWNSPDPPKHWLDSRTPLSKGRRHPTWTVYSQRHYHLGKLLTGQPRQGDIRPGAYEFQLTYHCWAIPELWYHVGQFRQELDCLWRLAHETKQDGYGVEEEKVNCSAWTNLVVSLLLLWHLPQINYFQVILFVSSQYVSKMIDITSSMQLSI